MARQPSWEMTGLPELLAPLRTRWQEMSCRLALLARRTG